MDWYCYVVWAAIISQGFFLYQIIANYIFAIKKIARNKRYYTPNALMIVPCKGIDAAFEKNIASFYRQDYPVYSLWFVVADTDDPAYSELLRLKEKLIGNTTAREVRILVAGAATSCSQKNHNLIHCWRQLPLDVEILAFADSDACLKENWLACIVHPLRKEKTGVATGYRWFVPQKNNSATVAMAAINAKVAQLLGTNRLNQPWGGSMAIRVKLFRELGIERLWSRSITDDLALSYAVRKAGKRIVFVPQCLVASHEKTNWRDFLSFARRQFLLTRITTPQIWWFGFLSSFYSVLGLYGGAAVAIYGYQTENIRWKFFALLPAVFFASHLFRSSLRQKLICKLLPQEQKAMRVSRFADIAAGWLLSVLLFGIIISSAFGRRIRWRGITYKLISAAETRVES